MHTKQPGICSVQNAKADRRSRSERENKLMRKNYIVVFVYNTTFFENCNKNPFLKCDNNNAKNKTNKQEIFLAQRQRLLKRNGVNLIINIKILDMFSHITQLLLIKSISACAHKPTSRFRISLVTRDYDCVAKNAC